MKKKELIEKYNQAIKVGDLMIKKAIELDECCDKQMTAGSDDKEIIILKAMALLLRDYHSQMFD